MSFEDALATRLDLIRPTRAGIEACLAVHPLPLSPGITELVSELHRRGTDVHLISGGFRLMVDGVARQLGLDHSSHVHANTLLFATYDPCGCPSPYGDGPYVNYDRREFTCRDGGKADCIVALKEKHGYQTVVMVGDGVTDLQARPPADVFIGYGGVVQREAVYTAADWFVDSFHPLIECLRERPKAL